MQNRVVFARGGDWQVSLGTGVGYAPRYEGAADNRLWVLPLLDVSYNRGGFFVGVARGIGFNFSDSQYIQYGVRSTLGQARSQDADQRLYGTGNIDYYLEGGAFLNVRLWLLSLNTSVASSDYGTHGDFSYTLALPLGEQDRFRIGGAMSFGDSMYNQTYFGITPAQSLASGNVLTPYVAAEGKKSTAASVSWTHNLDKHWFSSTGVTYKRLEGSAQLSPLTQRTSMLSANFLVGYRF